MSQPPLKPLEIEDLLIQYKSDQRKLEYQLHKLQAIIQELEKQFDEVRQALSLQEIKAPASAAKSKAADKPEKPKKRRGRPPKAKVNEEAVAKAPQEAEAKTEAAAETPAPEPTPKKRTSQKAAKGKKRGPGRPPKSGAEKKSTKSKKATSAKEDKPARLSDWDQFVVESLKDKQQSLITNDFLEIAKDNPDIKSGEAQIKVKLNRSLHKLANRKGLLVKVEHSGRGYAYALAEWVNSKGELPKKFAR